MNFQPSFVTDIAGQREKRLVALSSVVAAIFLTAMKIVVGLLTGSLGILSEAAHSGLDLIAAIVTLFAVRVSDRPPDLDHTYGHGKMENLSALVETLLLLGTCGWIVYEAMARLFFREVHVEVTVWSFVVMGTSILIDLTRSRALMRTAKKHGSQALEADAIHFSTDVWSSSVVIVGLIAVYIANNVTIKSNLLSEWLHHCDAIAALGVSAIVVYVSVQLGRRTINVLMDAAPKGVATLIQPAVARIPGVTAVDRIRVRQSGPATFVDVTLAVSRTASLAEAHEIAARAEAAVQRLIPHTDVMVHIDPAVRNDKSLVELVRSVAGQQGLSVHGLRIHDVRGQLALEMHAEVPDDLTVSQAHERVTVLEKTLSAQAPELLNIVIHIEPVGDAEARHEATATGSAGIQVIVREVARQLPEIMDCHNVTTLYEAGKMSMAFHCTLSSSLPILQAHDLTDRFERLLRERLRDLGNVTIHVEPPDS
jgi:cation diffusion facilitator family transporter